MLRMLITVMGATIFSLTASARDEVPRIEQQVLFKAGDGNYGGYRIPSLLVTSTPLTVLAFAEARQALDGFGVPFPDRAVTEVVMRRSVDGGRTWSKRQLIVESANVTTGNPCAVLDRDTGTISLVFCRGIPPAKAGGINKSAHVIKSTDDGLTWSKPADITSAAKGDQWKYVFTGPGSGIQLKTGRLLIPCSAEWGPQFSYMVYSDDHGATWQRTAPLVGEDSLDAFIEWQKLGKNPSRYSPNNVTDECGVVELADGRVYFNARSRLEVGYRAYAYSDDGGITWSKVKFHPELPES
ncbi:MAG: sialidase family protein, partial [Planctomycetaceae bacterium]